MPLVSVIMTAFNAMDTIDDSIVSILNQSFGDFELIIVNDGSTDKTPEIITEFDDARIVFINQKNQGPAIARNCAISKSTGKYIAILDSDDLALPQRLEKQVEFLNKHPDYVLIGSNALIIDRNSDDIHTSDMPLTWEEIETKFPFSSFYHSSVMYTSGAFKSCGGYHSEDKLYIFEDSWLWNKMKEYGKMANLSEPLIKYRLLPNSASASGKEAKLINKIFKETISENRISESNKRALSEIRNNINKVERERLYYLYIAKKLLWNNYYPSKSRANLEKAIKINPFRIFPYCLFIISFFPKKILLWFYRYKKSLKFNSKLS